MAFSVQVTLALSFFFFQAVDGIRVGHVTGVQTCALPILVLTINGKAEAVVQDAEAYQRLLDIAAQADALEGIRQGIEDIKKGRMRQAREALEMFRRNHADRKSVV